MDRILDQTWLSQEILTTLEDAKRFAGDNSGYRLDWRLPQLPWYEQLTLIRIFARLIDPSKIKRGISSYSVRSDVKKIKRGKRAYRKKIFKRNTAKYFERNLKSMIAMARMHGVKIMFATFAYHPHKKDSVSKKEYQKAIAEHNRIILGFSKEYGVPVYDFAEEMPTNSCDDCWWDGRHVNKKGARIKARLFADYIHEQELITEP